MLAQTVTDTAPWWGNGVLIAAGAVGGALLALVSARLSDRRRTAADERLVQQRYEREDAQRWDTLIRDAATSFLMAVGMAVNGHLTYHAYRYELGPGKFTSYQRIKVMLRRPIIIFDYVFDMWPATRAYNRFNQGRSELTRRYSELSLIAPEEIVTGADRLREATMAVTEYGNFVPTDEATKEFNAARSDFIQIVRGRLLSQPSRDFKPFAPERLT